MPDELDEEPTTATASKAAPTKAAPAKATTKTTAEAAPRTVPTSAATPAPRPSDRVFTGFGIGSAVLAVVAVAAVVLATMTWVGHRNDVDERAYQTRVLQAAAEWTGVLINMNSGSVIESMKTLHDGTVGQLNANFETAVEPFSQVVQKLQSQTVGQVESVAIESLYHAKPGDAALPAPPQPELSTVASRTDDVIVVATSISQNAGTSQNPGAKPLTVHWNLRLAVSDVDGKLLVSRLETIR